MEVKVDIDESDFVQMIRDEFTKSLRVKVRDKMDEFLAEYIKGLIDSGEFEVKSEMKDAVVRIMERYKIRVMADFERWSKK